MRSAANDNSPEWGSFYRKMAEVERVIEWFAKGMAFRERINNGRA